MDIVVLFFLMLHSSFITGLDNVDDMNFIWNKRKQVFNYSHTAERDSDYD